MSVDVENETEVKMMLSLSDDESLSIVFRYENEKVKVNVPDKRGLLVNLFGDSSGYSWAQWLGGIYAAFKKGTTRPTTSQIIEAIIERARAQKVLTEQLKILEAARIPF